MNELYTIWVTFIDEVGEPKEYRFQTTIKDLQEGEIVIVATVNGEYKARVMTYGHCEKPFMLKKVLSRSL